MAAGEQGCTLEKKGKLGPESPDYNIAALIEDNLAVEVGMMAVFNGLNKYNLWHCWSEYIMCCSEMVGERAIEDLWVCLFQGLQ